MDVNEYVREWSHIAVPVIVGFVILYIFYDGKLLSYSIPWYVPSALLILVWYIYTVQRKELTCEPEPQQTQFTPPPFQQMPQKAPQPNMPFENPPQRR